MAQRNVVIRIELVAGSASTPAGSLETQDVGPETIDHAGHSPEKIKVDQPTLVEASKKAASVAGLAVITSAAFNVFNRCVNCDMLVTITTSVSLSQSGSVVTL